MKTVLITGGSSGIGKATAMQLAAKDYQVIFIARNKDKAEAVKNEIIANTKNENTDYLIADMTSVNQVQKSAESFKMRYQKLDVLINNAGVCLPERRITENGLEESFQINHLSHFMLSILLLGELKNSDNPRIINVSSAVYASGKFDPENLQSEKKFGSFSTYCNTKLLNMLFTSELAERLKDTPITVNALHPGVVHSNFAHELGGIFNFLNKMAKPFYLSPEKGAATSVYLATSPEVRNITGKYFVRCKQVEPRNKYLTPENGKILWDESLRLSGLKDEI